MSGRAIFQRPSSCADCFPGITDNAKARACARTISEWQPMPVKAATKGARVVRLTPRRDKPGQ